MPASIIFPQHDFTKPKQGFHFHYVDWHDIFIDAAWINNHKK